MKLPDSWIKATLSDVCHKIVDGSHNPPKPQSSGFPMLSAKNINDGKISFDNFRFISEIDFQQENKRTEIKENDVLLTIVGAIGRTAVVDGSIPPFTLQRSVAVLKPCGVDSKYIKYALDEPRVQNYLRDNAKGTAQKGIYLNALAAVEIVLAPEKEQGRIADKLDTMLTRVDALNDRLARITPLLKRFRQSVLAAATSGRLTVDWRDNSAAEWVNCKLGELMDGKPRNGYSPKAVDYETSVRSLTLSATTSGTFNGKHSKYIDESIPDESHLWLKPGDILIQRANSLEYVGVSAIFNGPENTYIYPDLMMKARANNCTTSNFLHLLLCAEETRRYFRENATGTAGNMPKINQQTVMNAPCKVPLLDEQTEIVRRVEILFAYADRLEACLQTARTAADRLTPALLAKAFRGELVPQDPNDEPATELLRRLREARAAESPPRKMRTRKVLVN